VVVVRAKDKGPTPQELADLTTEAINAVIETQQSYARDWARNLHGEWWQEQFAARQAE
jgi:hypothetical protein